MRINGALALDREPDGLHFEPDAEHLAVRVVLHEDIPRPLEPPGLAPFALVIVPHPLRDFGDVLETREVATDPAGPAHAESGLERRPGVDAGGAPQGVELGDERLAGIERARGGA